jgi:hypothetical protein
MHRSRLCHIIIDCHDLNAGAQFWAKALGTEVGHVHHPWAWLKTAPGWLAIGIEEVAAPNAGGSPIHLDIETDDVEAEVRRLEALGARRARKVESWWIMLDPSGNEFCVVPPQRPDFPTHAAEWETKEEPASMPECTVCGAAVAEQATACPACGTALAAAEPGLPAGAAGAEDGLGAVEATPPTPPVQSEPGRPSAAGGQAE